MTAVVAISLVPDLVGTEPEPGRGAAFLLLLAFLISFAFIRTSARLMRSPRVPWWPGSVTTGSGLHIHHLVWGVSLLLIAGFFGFAIDLDEPWWQITAVAFGVGAGLALDEFALWLHLEDVYWSEEGRVSIDAVVLAAVFAGLVVVGVQPFGLDEPESVVGVTLAAVLNITLAALTFLKGRLLLGVVSIFAPIFGLVAALRLARPASPWARWFYRRAEGSKLIRAEERFRLDRSSVALGRRLQDLIGGAPSNR